MTKEKGRRKRKGEGRKTEEKKREGRKTEEKRKDFPPGMTIAESLSPILAKIL
nr:hypothetical protein [uncultured Prevotella sp.]